MFFKRMLQFGSTAMLPVAAVLFSLHVGPVSAATIACTSASADPDGDGFGWENNRSCYVVKDCGSNASDSDGDGFGFEDGRSCRITASNGGSSSAVSNECSSRDSDTDGDGFGFENGRSCRVTLNSNSTVSVGINECRSRASDFDGDGFGFEDGSSCRVTSNSSTEISSTPGVTPGAAPSPVAAANNGFKDGRPICLTDASDAGSNGFGFENNRTCVVVEGVTSTRNQPLLNQRSCIPWLEIGYGNYKIQNNVWNFGAVFSNNWSQCIELTGGPGNYVAKWDYNWLQRNQGDEFAVKSYPQVYYGRKTRYHISGSVEETGLPALTDRLPQFWVHYDYSETGIVERNVALESFFHTSCETEDYNKQYEMMVWVGVPNIRTPGKLVTTVTLSGQEWDVFTNPSLSWSYVAFVAKQPSNRGTLDWNAFVNWSRNVGPSVGVPSMYNHTCMGAIEIGTETFWGTGTFTLNRFQVDRS